MTSASKTSMISFSSVDINNFHELGSFESRHYELSNLISKLDVNMSVDAVILNYNFTVTCIIQIDNSSYNVSIFERLSWRTVLPSDKKASQLCGEMDLYTAKYSNYPTEPSVACTRVFSRSDNFLKLSLYSLLTVSSKITSETLKEH